MANQFSSGDFNPIEFASASHFIILAGTKSPGAIAVDGIHGFERETGWDKKAGKGTQGATLTLKTFPPAEGSIDFQLWTPQQFEDWDFFRALLRYNPAKKASGAADALDIFHPALARVGVNKVVTHKVSPERHVGMGKYIITVDFIEWLPPPPVSIVQTTTASKVGAAGNTPGTPTDPIGDAQQKVIGNLMKEAATTPTG